MERTGFLSIPEGQVFWKLNLPPGPFPKHKPILLFIHAGVADHTLWDEQVQHLTSRGWPTLRYDLFGFGQSAPNQAYLAENPRHKVDYISHVASLVTDVWQKELWKEEALPARAVVIGLSMGGGLAINFALARGELCAGVVATAAGLSGYQGSSKPEEVAMMTKADQLMEAGNANELAKLNVHYWGDGPLQEEGRLAGPVREKLFEWCLDIATRECKKIGGSIFPSVSLEPPAAHRLGDIRVPVGVGIGLLDESETVAAMSYLAQNCRDTLVASFESGHMVNLEFPQQYNEWLEDWLNRKIGK